MAFSGSELYVALAAKDLAKLCHFYRCFLECDPHPYIPNRFAKFHCLGLQLVLFSPQTSHQQTFFKTTGGALSLCLEVKDLEAEIRRLDILGYPPPGTIIEASHGREIYVYDPEQNRLILHQAK